VSALTPFDRSYVQALLRYERARLEKAPTHVVVDRLRDVHVARARLGRVSREHLRDLGELALISWVGRSR
jgi:hypothetical protein